MVLTDECDVYNSAISFLNYKQPVHMTLTISSYGLLSILLSGMMWT